MLAIRLARVGKKNKAQYKIVLQEKTAAPGGRHVEILGSYDPHLKMATFQKERVKYWLGNGAEASDTAYNLFVSNGVIVGKKRKVKVSKKTKKGSAEEGAPEEKKETKGDVKAEDKSVEKKEEVKKEKTSKEEEIKVEEKRNN